MAVKPLIALGASLALAAGTLVAAPLTAASAGPVSVLSLLQPHALDDRVAEDGTPIAVKIPGSERVIGARPSSTPKVVDLATPAVGTRYFVDCQATGSNAGTQADPFTTLAAASGVTLQPGDQLLFKRGTTCEGQLLPKGSGTEGKRIAIDAYGDVADPMPLLEGKGVESVVRLNNQQYWQIRNLEITNFTNDSRDYTTARRGIVVALTDFGRGQDYEVSDNYIHHVWGHNRKDLGGSGGIQFEAYSSVAPTGRYAPCTAPCKPTAFDGINIHHNVVQNVNRSGINVGSNFRSRESVGGSIQDYTFFEWGPMHTHDNLVSNVGGDAIVVQFASESVVENNTVWDSSNFHGGKSNNGNNAAVWSWDADRVVFRQNHVFQTKMPAGTWDGTAFDADYGTTGTVFEYNLTHENEGGFMLFCGCGGLSTGTVMRYNISLADGAGAEDHAEGPRLFFQAGQSDGEVYGNTFLLQPNVHLNKGGSQNTAVLFANNAFLAQGEVRSVFSATGSGLGEVWRNNLYAGTWNGWPNEEANVMAAGLEPLAGAGLARIQPKTQSVIGRGVPIAPEGTLDIAGRPVPHTLPVDIGAFQHTTFPANADVTVKDGGFENATSEWDGGTVTTSTKRNGTKAMELSGGATATQTVKVAANRTYRLTAAVQGTVQVTATAPSGAVATASQAGAAAAGWTPMSTVLRTASDASVIELTLSGTGHVDDVAMEEITDYAVDGSFESPGNTPWRGTRANTRTAVSGQTGTALNAGQSTNHPEILVPGPGTYEVWGWAKSGSGTATIAATGAGGTAASTAVDSRSWQQGRVTFSPTESTWGNPDISRFTVTCSAAAGAATVNCDDIMVTDVWDQGAPAVAASGSFTIPSAPADPPAPPRPIGPTWVPISDVTVVGASSQEGATAQQVNDGNDSTIWHSAWSASKPPPPHWVTLKATGGYVLDALGYLPRQDGNLNGRAKDYTVFASESGDFSADGVVVAKGTLPSISTMSTIEFTTPTQAPFIRFQIDSAYIKADDPHQYGTAATIRLGGYKDDGTAAPAFTAMDPVEATIGEALEIKPVLEGGTAPLYFYAPELPEGLTIDTATGVISGTPTQAGSYTIELTARDQRNRTANLEIQVTVTDPTSPSPSPSPSASPSASPSVSPSASPSASPSKKPTPSKKPSVKPTVPGDEFVRTVPYTKPGTHSLNGRQWMTVCEDYSQTERCRTEIWATVVKVENGQFVRESGWAFNNLTYLPFMTREAWKGNPLGDLGSTSDGVFTSGGRQWRTECDTAATGRGACRSYTWTTVYAATPKATGGYTFSQKNDWVFNNIVMFKN